MAVEIIYIRGAKASRGYCQVWALETAALLIRWKTKMNLNNEKYLNVWRERGITCFAADSVMRIWGLRTPQSGKVSQDSSAWAQSPWNRVDSMKGVESIVASARMGLCAVLSLMLSILAKPLALSVCWQEQRMLFFFFFWQAFCSDISGDCCNPDGAV